MTIAHRRRLASLRLCHPNEDLGLLITTSRRRRAPIQWIVTTHSRANRRGWKILLALLRAPYFRLRFAFASGDVPDDLPGNMNVVVYPRRLAGDLYRIRRWIEEQFWTPWTRLVISDDDPGEQRREVKFRTPQIVIPDASASAGAHYPAATTEQYAMLWHLAFDLGRRRHCGYVGLYTAGHSLRLVGPKSVRLDVAVVNVAGIIRPLRALVPRRFRRLHQEWLTASVVSLANGFGTLVLTRGRNVFRVRSMPKRLINREIELLRRFFRRPDGVPIIRRGSGGRGSRSGCIAHLTTAKNVSLTEALP